MTAPQPQPTITVVIAARNAAPTIGQALDSILGQDYPEVEVIVIDGASQDDTRAEVEARSGRLAYWVSEPDTGVYQAWNKGLAHATGDWVMFLGADDRLSDPTSLSRVAHHLVSIGPELRVVYGKVAVVDGDDNIVRTLGEPWPSVREEFRDHMVVPHPATLHSRTLFAEHGSFDEGFRIAGDYEFLLRELLDHDALFVPDVLVRMRAGGLSDRPSTAALMARETYRARHRHGLVSQPAWRSMPLHRAVAHAHISRYLGRRAADRVGDVYRFVTRSKRS